MTLCVMAFFYAVQALTINNPVHFLGEISTEYFIFTSHGIVIHIV